MRINCGQRPPQPKYTMGLTKRLNRVSGLLLAVVVLLAVWCEPALAQCAMCKQSVASSADGASAASGINLGVLVLLIPPVAIFAGIFGLVYRMRNDQNVK